MAGDRWLFTEEQLANTPSRQCGIDAEKEKCYRQQAANFMQEMGQRLTVSQLCINTGIVYLHRFYMFQSFTRFHRNSMAQACLFLAAKVEEQPRKLEHVIKVAHMILHRDQPPLDTKSVAYLDQAQELVINENILLQTLGFELQVDHPHAHIVKTCNLIKAPKDLTQTSYFLATNSLHLTLMSLRYKPTFVACVCIHLACKWAKFRIPRSSAGKEWWYYVDKDMTSEALEEITQSFLAILDKCPNKFKKKLVSKSAKDEDFFSLMQFPQDKKPKAEASATVTKDSAATCGLSPSTSQHTATGVNHEASPQKSVKNSPKPETATSRPQVSVADNTMRRVKTESYLTSLTTKEYFERKERERREREQLEKERQKMAEKKEVTEHAASTDRTETRQHTNIFDQIISDKQQQQQQQHITESSLDVTDNASASKNRQSLERTHAEHNYKERYHHKERAEKLPFAPLADLSKEQIKSSSHRPSQRPNPATLASAHLSRDPKQKGRSHERRHPEHRVPPRHEQVKAPVSETAKTKTVIQELGKASPTQVDPEEKVPRIDPEEGEILDDDSPLTVPHDKTTVQQDGDRGYHHQHQHRERRLSGRHTTPPPGHSKISQPPRHRSPRMATKQDETHGQPQPRAEHKPSKFEVSVPQPTVKLPDIESLHTKALSESKPATPEPGEIVEHGQKHHHKSSRSKTHKKDKHRDRESSHESSGSLKIKLDLKGMSSSKQATTVTSGDERKKEIKLKIKPPSLTGGGDRETHDSGLKMKLKVPPPVVSPVKGNGEPAKLEHHKSGSNAIKLTLSKDSQSGQFTAHKVHNRHAEKAMASRKRPYSPTEAPILHHQNKLPRNDPERHHHHHHGNDIGASLLTDNAACAPLISTSAPNPARVEDIQRQLDRLIAKKTEEIQQQKLGSTKKMHHEGLSNPSSGTFPHPPPPPEPSHTLPHS